MRSNLQRNLLPTGKHTASTRPAITHQPLVEWMLSKVASKSSYRQVENRLICSGTCRNIKQTKNCFPRLKVQSFQLNEVCSVDLAEIQQLSRYHHIANFISVADDSLNCFFSALALKKRHLQNVILPRRESYKLFVRQMTAKQQWWNPSIFIQNRVFGWNQRKFGSIKIENLPANFLISAKKIKSMFAQHIVKPNQFLLNETLDHWKHLFLNFAW